MDADRAARRWAETWARSWPRKDVEAIAELYGNDAVYRALPFREPRRGVDGVRAYLSETFAVEDGVECWFGDPVTAATRAAVEWWGTWLEAGSRVTLAGATMLRFDDEGRVVDHRDYWNELDRREAPYGGW